MKRIYIMALLGLAASLRTVSAQIPPPPIYTNTFPHGTNVFDYTAFYSNNLASVQCWLTPSITNADGTPSTSLQDYADTAATTFSSSGAFSWQESVRDEALTWATAVGVPLNITNGVNLGAFLVSRENDVPNYVASCDTAGAITINTTNVWPGGTSGFTLTALAGTNTTISQWDEGSPLLSHTEFSGRVVELDGDTNLADHSTAVAGIMAAAGANIIFSNGVSLGTAAKGMAYSANIQAWEFINDVAAMTASVGSNHMRLSNHSYELIDGWYYAGPGTWEWLGYGQLGTQDPRFGNYTSNTAPYDVLAYAAPTYLQCWAAGNEQNYGPSVQPTNHYEFTLVGGTAYVTNATRALDGDQGGFNTLSQNAVAKDILTVGAINPLPAGFTSPTNVVIASFSSLGPTGDGRIKPDVVADGVNNIVCLAESTFDYGIGSGTSFATPSVTGSIDLLRSWYTQTHTNSSDLLSSTVKGLVIETADPCTTNQGPSYTFGWGVMNTLKAANLINADATNGFKNQVKEVLLPNGLFVKAPVVVASTNTPLKVTICWVDPAATGNAITNLHNPAIKLVNDLDLRLISSTGVTNFPWILNPDLTNRTSAARSALATTGDDARNNVEQVYIPHPSVGTYTLQVTHKGTLSGGQQWVSILVSGNVAQSAPPLKINQILQTGTNQMSVGWPAVVGGQYQVQQNSNLATTNWVNAGGIVSARLTNVVTQVTMTNAQAFYRVIQEP